MRRLLSLASLLVLAPPLAAQIPAAEYASRRAALLAQLDSGIVIAAGAREPIAHAPPFIQLPAFRYLTGYLEPDAALVLVKRGGTSSATMLVPPVNPAGALFTGRRPDPAAIAAELGMAVRNTDALVPLLDSLIATRLPVYVVGDFVSNEFAANDSLSYMRTLVRQLHDRYAFLDVRDATPYLDALRARKSDAEVALLRKAAQLSSEGHRAVLGMIAPGRAEYEVQATLEYTFRRLGGDGVAYASIVGSGPNSTTLHYDAGDRVLQKGEVVLMDVAAAYKGYMADLTRTVPVSGTFSPEQRAIYQLVLDAQKAEEAVIKAGTPRQAATDTAHAVLANGLAKLGLIEAPDATYDAPPGVCPWRRGFRAEGAGCPQWYLYSYHGYSHGLGLDVHDLTQGRAFQVGDVFTIEPGIYVREQVLSELPDTPRNRSLIAKAQAAALRYRNIGVRIEDDYVLGAGGLKRITDSPREIAEIEAAMKGAGGKRK